MKLSANHAPCGYSRLPLGVILAGLAAAACGCWESSAPPDPNEAVIYMALGAKVSGLDPGDIGDTTSSTVAAQIFECLYEYHYLKRPYELVPQLADGMPSASQDGLTYTISIKKGARFADDACFKGGKGRELKAGDFIFAWKRIADIKYVSKNWWIFDGRIKGLDEFREYTKTRAGAGSVDYDRPVEGLRAIDDYTLEIRLARPWPQITYLLAHIPTAPVAREAVEYYGKDIINHPVGTGPFVLKKWHRGSYLELARNCNWTGPPYPSEGEPGDIEDGLLADAGRPLPLADRMLVVFVQEDPPRWFLFMQGKIDISGIPKDNFAEAVDHRGEITDRMRRRNIKLQVFREPSTYWLGFNMEDPVLGTNRPLRKAISCAIDRNKYIELFTNGRGDAAYGFIPPVMEAYDPNIGRFADSDYDPRRAAELVEQAEEVHGGPIPKLVVAMPGTDAVSRQRGEFLGRCLAAAGLKVEIDYMDWPTFQNAVKTRSAQIFTLGWIADYPDAENFLQLFYSRNASPGPNNFNYSNSAFDRIYERVSAMQDGPARTALYREAQRIVVEDCPAVFVMHGVAYALVHDWVRNYKPNAFGYGIFKYMGIDAPERRGYCELFKAGE